MGPNGEIKRKFPLFLEEEKDNILTDEYLIISVVDSLVSDNKAKVKVLTSKEQWYGVTYKEDKPKVKAVINALIEKGSYPMNLWGGENEY